MQIYPFKIDQKEAVEWMKRLNVSSQGINIMKQRFEQEVFFIRNISTPGANAIKQHLLSLGGEAAVPRHAITCQKEKSDLLFSIRRDKIKTLASKLLHQCWKLPQVAEFLLSYCEMHGPWYDFQDETLKTDKPLVMGILNMTPDSFSDGGAYNSDRQAEEKIKTMIDKGVDIIDIGGESSRPGAESVSAEDELKRVLPALERVRAMSQTIPVSIDTVKALVAEKALKKGATMINDITGMQDVQMRSVAAQADVPVVVMHMQGTPRTMQKNPTYENVISEINSFFSTQIEKLIDSGVKKEKILLDPGVGFGKTLSHNLFIIKHLDAFSLHRMPILAGFSRKSFIGMVTERQNPLDREAGTVASHLVALQKGAAVIRVHNVDDGIDTVKMHLAFEETLCC